MVSIVDNIITMNRGDYFKVPIFINAGNELYPARYKLQTNDKIIFRLYDVDQKVLEKELTQSDLDVFGDAVVILNDTDTKDIPQGSYYYEITLLVKSGQIYKNSVVMPKRTFNLM